MSKGKTRPRLEPLLAYVLNLLDTYSSSSLWGETALMLLAFSRVTTFLPLLDSNCLRATAATEPPASATCAFSLRVLGLRCCDISVVDASASIFMSNYRLVLLSRRLSVFRPLYCLYCFVVIPDQADVMISVSVAYCCPF